MPKTLEKLLLILIDFFTIATSFLLWAWLRREMGFFSESDITTLVLISCFIYLYWFFFFTFFGLYGSWYAQSRVDELIAIFKTISIGVIVIFLVTFDATLDLSQPPNLSRMFIVNYWLVLMLFVITGRMLFRSVQRWLLEVGVGHRKTVIVGWNNKARELFDEMQKYPALGYKVVGFLTEKPAVNATQTYQGVPVLGGVEQIDTLSRQVEAQEIVFALKGDARRRVMDVLGLCNGLPVNFKIVPDLYDIVIGQARTNQIYGFPLIDIMPNFMPAWERRVKRMMDVGIATTVMVLGLPLWLLVALLIKVDSKGPVFYKQERVGKDGKVFMIQKFRSMVHNAESMTGPQWAQKRDPRVTRVGRWLRSLRLDEVPQFINVLRGEMSLIGPRPERPFFVEKFKQVIPFYTRRMKVRPGITGWAQIKGGYDTSLENVKTKLQYDLFYLDNLSLRMDLKIILSTIYIMLRGKGQ